MKEIEIERDNTEFFICGIFKFDRFCIINYKLFCFLIVFGFQL